MKKLAVVLAVLMIGISPFGCETGEVTPTPTSTPVPSGLGFEIPWGDNEWSNYNVEDITGNVIGSAEMTVQKENDDYLLGLSFNFDSVAKDVTVKVRGDNLKPVSSRQVLSTDEGEVEMVSKYGEGRVSTTTYIVEEGGGEEGGGEEGRQQQAIIGIPSDAYDNDEALFLGRALPFEVGYYIEFTGVIITQIVTPIVAFTVVGREEVEVPAGTFDCYKVKYGSIAGTVQSYMWMWYSVDEPHHLVKYSSGQSTFVLTEHS